MVNLPTQLQVGVKILFKNRQNKYLLLKRSDRKYAKTQGSWDIPGGRINPGTDLLSNLRREIKEETGFDYVGTPKLIAAQDILKLPEKHVVRLTYLGEIEGTPVLDDENMDYAWVSKDEMSRIDDLDAFVRELLDKKLF